MRRGPPPFGGPTETGLSDAIGVPEGTCICEGCLADFEAIRDGFASLDDWEDRYRYVIEFGRSGYDDGRTAVRARRCDRKYRGPTPSHAANARRSRCSSLI
jgi:hypothetical protein